MQDLAPGVAALAGVTPASVAEAAPRPRPRIFYGYYMLASMMGIP